MEPCSHVGRTGACHQALIDSGVHSVVVAHQDPFEQVNGQGIAQLRNAGIEVRVGLLESAAQELNRGFLSTVRRQRPWVQLKMGMSLDGRTALDNGRSKWITSTRARADVQYWRARSSAILTGSGTVLADDPLLTVRQLSSPEALAPVRVVLDSQGRVPATARVFNDQAPSLHVVHRECPLASSDSEQVMALPGDDQGLHLEQLLHNLSQRGLHDLLVEAGPTLAGNLLKAHLVMSCCCTWLRACWGIWPGRWCTCRASTAWRRPWTLPCMTSASWGRTCVCACGRLSRRARYERPPA